MNWKFLTFGTSNYRLSGSALSQEGRKRKIRRGQEKKPFTHADILSKNSLRVDRGHGGTGFNLGSRSVLHQGIRAEDFLTAVKHSGGTLIFWWGGPLRVAGGGWDPVKYKIS